MGEFPDSYSKKKTPEKVVKSPQGPGDPPVPVPGGSRPEKGVIDNIKR